MRQVGDGEGMLACLELKLEERFDYRDSSLTTSTARLRTSLKSQKSTSNSEA